jgi:hypothetical protein
MGDLILSPRIGNFHRQKEMELLALLTEKLGFCRRGRGFNCTSLSLSGVQSSARNAAWYLPLALPCISADSRT